LPIYLDAAFPDGGPVDSPEPTKLGVPASAKQKLHETGRIQIHREKSAQPARFSEKISMPVATIATGIGAERRLLSDAALALSSM
jgi:hypothetical protein